MRRFDHYARSQRWIWATAKALAEEYDLGEPIDVIADALVLYKAALEKKEGETDAETPVSHD